MQILIRNLNRRTTEADLYDLFKTFGIVETCTLVLDKETGNSKGFGFTTMASDDDSKKAIEELDGMTIDGNKIRVKKAKPQN